VVTGCRGCAPKIGWFDAPEHAETCTRRAIAPPPAPSRSLPGPITDKLAATLQVGSALYTPTRPPEAIRDMQEHQYTGRTLAPAYRRIGRHDIV
jgi:hypothetical protein